MIKFNKLLRFIVIGTCPLFFLMGFLSLFGEIPVHYNGVPKYGVLGFILMQILGLSLSLCLTVNVWLLGKLGEKIENFFRKRIIRN